MAVAPEEREEVTRLLWDQQPFRCVPVYLDEKTAEVRNSGNGLVYWGVARDCITGGSDGRGGGAISARAGGVDIVSGCWEGEGEGLPG